MKAPVEVAPLRRRERLGAAERKRQIVQVALAIAGERGIQAVSTQLIADTIGRSQGVVFRHFPNKEALWAAVIEWLAARLHELWTRARTQGSIPGQELRVLRAILLGHVTLVATYPGLAKLVMSDDLRQQFPQVDTGFAEIHRRYSDEVLALLQGAMAARSIRADADLQSALALFFCMIQGLAFQSAITGTETNAPARAVSLFGLFEAALASPARTKSELNRTY